MSLHGTLGLTAPDQSYQSTVDLGSPLSSPFKALSVCLLLMLSFSMCAYENTSDRYDVAFFSDYFHSFRYLIPT